MVLITGFPGGSVDNLGDLLTAAVNNDETGFRSSHMHWKRFLTTSDGFSLFP